MIVAPAISAKLILWAILFPARKCCSGDPENNISRQQSAQRHLQFHGPFMDPYTQRHPSSRIKRQASLVGSPCFESTDCQLNGMFCDGTQRCVCLSTYVEIGGSCWTKVNPDEAGCVNNRQCSAVWPGAYCNSGVCKCANGQEAFITADGRICLEYGSCPTNGDNTKYIATPGGNPQQCNGDDAFCPATYDCICNKPGCGLTGEGGGDDVVSFCCPSRAMACIQDKDEGRYASAGAGAAEYRWYMNPITENCEQFMFRGAGGNANNFRTREQCDSYCKGACRRGRPEYRDATDFSVLPFKQTKQTCTTTGDCRENNECVGIGTISLCCPTSSFVCTASNEPNPGDGTMPATIARWRYDNRDKQCKHFFYNGQGGSFNNFLTQDHCELFCAESTCTAGRPLKGLNGGPKICNGNQDCPTSHQCSGSDPNRICCPRAQSVCTLPRTVGSCFNYVQRWWYNAATSTCERFTYSGCQGNSNNFRTSSACNSFCGEMGNEPRCIQGKALKDGSGIYLACGGLTTATVACPTNYDCYFDGSTHGCCPTQAYTCSIGAEGGTECGPTVTRWFYNSNSRSCQTFKYRGCDGNSNNFATQVDCQDYCAVGGCPEGGEPYRDQTGVHRVCLAGGQCPSSHYCTKVALTTAVSGYYCCPTRSFVCSQPQDFGSMCTSKTMTRYFFNPTTKSCESFAYNGCGGNRNNFPNTEQCLNYCNSAGCPAGTVALYDRASTTLTSCAIGTVSCPPGYACTYSSLLRQAICCGSQPAEDKCRVGESIYIDSLTNRPRQCLANVDDACPVNFVCLYSVTSNAYHCCGSSASMHHNDIDNSTLGESIVFHQNYDCTIIFFDTCPQGGNAFLNPITATPQQCTPGIVGACQPSYTCQATFVTINGIPSTTGYCCGNLGFCNSGEVQTNSNNQPVSCNSASAAQTCTPPFNCQYSNSMSEYYCCSARPAVSIAVCGSAATPYMLNGAPVACNTAARETNCPSPFVCQLYAETNIFYCCKPGGLTGFSDTMGQVPVAPSTPAVATTSGCPPGLVAFLTNGQVQYCTPYPNSCPTPSHCLYDASALRYICCGYWEVSNTGNPPVPRTTTPTVPSTVCPGALKVYLNEFTQQPQTCLPAWGGCPREYACTRAVDSNVFYCCQATVARDQDGCEAGKAYLYPGTTIPLECRQDPSAPCPTGYNCTKSQRFTGRFLCCSTAVTRSLLTDDQPVTLLKLGDRGCKDDYDCTRGGPANSRCVAQRCLCPSNLIAYSGRCVQSCPWPYMNVAGVCSSSSFMKTPERSPFSSKRHMLPHDEEERVALTSSWGYSRDFSQN